MSIKKNQRDDDRNQVNDLSSTCGELMSRIEQFEVGMNDLWDVRRKLKWLEVIFSPSSRLMWLVRIF